MFAYDLLYDLLLGDLDLSPDFASLPDPHESGSLGGLQSTRRRALATAFLKKLAPLGNSEKADKAAVDNFKSINEQLPTDSWDYVAECETDAEFYDYFKNNLDKVLGDAPGTELFVERHAETGEQTLSFNELDLPFIREFMSIGPGASQLAIADNIVTKLFEGTVSHYGSEYLIALYRAAIVETGAWSDAERLRFERFGFTEVEGGKGFCAPKNAEISRFCCTEALLDLLFQKAAGAFIEKRVDRCFGVSLSKQPVYNRMMAMRGSIDQSIGTIDLKSASDMIGYHMLDKSLRECSLKRMLKMCRAKSVTLPGGETVVLNMVSTMGNGFTFPLQTAIFACVIRSVYQQMDLPSWCPKTQFGVFGDDLCVRREAYDAVCRQLQKLGFVVNDRKSFNEGPFRESCGEDYYLGINIRGVYVKSLETPQQICSLLNRLNRWSARHGIELPATTSYLVALMPDAPKVPPSEDDEAGIHVPFECTRPKVEGTGYWFKYRAWARRSRKVTVREPDASIRDFIDDDGNIDNEGWKRHNPFGVMCGFLSGHVKRAEFRRVTVLGDLEIGAPDAEYIAYLAKPVRVAARDPDENNVRYRIQARTIPWWDYTRPGDTWVGIGYHAWKRVVAAQLK